MSTLEIKSMKITTNNLGSVSAVPSFLNISNVQQVRNSELDEDDEVFVGYGFVNNVFPYVSRDLYDSNFSEKEYKSVVLENQFLKAVFLPELGGRLWSLYDKQKDRELLLNGDEFAFANLAVRDAWFCGGVEWNMGIVGHSPFTCEKVYTALTSTDDGTPVVRFYEYERIRRCTYQVDCWLPEDSKKLYVGVRIVNSSDHVVPMYWWSNIAIPEDKDSRVVVPANEAYTQADLFVKKVKQFKTEERDITYPVQNPVAVDYFWKTKNAKHKFVSYLDKDGYGLCQASSSRQMGRKLFVWGQGNGGNHWQEFLRVQSESGHYIEIQAGLGQTQYECLPMPPNTAWEWVESYGAIHADPDKVHGKYDLAARCVEGLVSEENLDDALKNASHMRRKAEKVIQQGSVWGAVEEKKREYLGKKPLNPNLDFFCDESNEWIELLQSGTLGKHEPCQTPFSWMMDAEYTRLLEDALCSADSDNWYSWMHMGMIKLAGGDREKAVECFKKSIGLCENVWSYYGLMCIYCTPDNKEKAVETALKVFEMANGNVTLTRNALSVLNTFEEYDRIAELTERLPSETATDGRVLLYRVAAMLRNMKIDEAEELMDKYKDEICTNIREGECSVTQLRMEFLKLKAERNGEPTDGILPENEWNFLMNI